MDHHDLLSCQVGSLIRGSFEEKALMLFGSPIVNPDDA